jgi:uncharacterized protein (DUF433 family)
MPTTAPSRHTEPWRRRLRLPAYSLTDAARYARVHPNTVRYWYYGRAESEGRHRARPTLSEKERGVSLTYLQLIEVAVVSAMREYVSLKEIQRTHDYMAQTLGSEFPFAEYRFKTDGIHLLLTLDQVEPVPHVNALIQTNRAGQELWAEFMRERLDEFVYEGDNGLAIQWKVGGRGSDVIIDPRVSFGAPMVRGVPTFAVRGRYMAGEEIADIQDDFGLEESEVRDALKFEGIEATV